VVVVIAILVTLVRSLLNPDKKTEQPQTPEQSLESKIKNQDPIRSVRWTGRGPLVDDEAVAAALRSKKLGGYASDVLSVEPPPADHPLFGCPNCIITPHIAWQTFEARSRLLTIAVDNFKSFLAGKPKNTI